VPPLDEAPVPPLLVPPLPLPLPLDDAPPLDAVEAHASARVPAQTWRVPQTK
jgi:hypothetical protein